MEHEDIEFLQILGYLYLQYGRIDEARVIYKTLVEITDCEGIVTIAYAYCLVYQGNFNLALHQLKKVKSETLTAREKSGYFLLLSNVQWSLGDYSEARKVFRQFLDEERKRAAQEPLLPSLFDYQKEVLGQESHSGTKQKKEKPLPAEGLWKRILRFVARKDLNRELGR